VYDDNASAKVMQRGINESEGQKKVSNASDSKNEQIKYH